ncbi:MAG TPA: hypothetical protein VHE35_00790 [Kofleriaceae bacterium]|nr:hypothetical protein [Kofleriaceae bacterium]
MARISLRLSFGDKSSARVAHTGVRRTRRASFACIAFAGVTALAGIVRPAAAQSPAPETTAEAEQLFRDGKTLMAAGDFARACEAFEGSARKDALPSTLVNLADCREKNQQYASAWGAFVEAARLTRNAPAMETLHQVAEDRAAALEPRLSFLIINVPDEARIDGLVIKRNGEIVDPASWNRDMPVDGGTYTIEAKAPAYEPWTATVKVAAAQDKQSVNVPKFAAAAPTLAVKPAPARGSSSSFTGERKAAVGAWAVGAIGLGAGVALELKSGGTYDDAKAAATDARRHDLTDDANRERLYATVAAGVGVAAIGAGIYLWLDGKPRRRDAVAVRPTVTPHGLAAVLTTRF